MGKCLPALEFDPADLIPERHHPGAPLGLEGLSRTISAHRPYVRWLLNPEARNRRERRGRGKPQADDAGFWIDLQPLERARIQGQP